MWRGDRSDKAPRSYGIAAGFVGSILGFVLAGSLGADHATKSLVVALVAAGPQLFVEMLWKRRRRRGEEQLLVFPQPGDLVRGHPLIR